VTVVLPLHDGIAQYVAARLPQIVVRPYEDDASEDFSDVTFCCLPYMRTMELGALLNRMPALEVVQSLSSGVDDLVEVLPRRLILCNGRNLHHEESTAELAVLLVLASLRGLPRFVRAQDRRQWLHERASSLDERRVLLIGYGAIGVSIEARLLPFGARITRVARTARDGVASAADLPRLARTSDVMIVCLPLTRETRGIISANVLSALLMVPLWSTWEEERRSITTRYVQSLYRDGYALRSM
jgi:phosphoglycerate dehydrogenase-like enzyme